MEEGEGGEGGKGEEREGNETITYAYSSFEIRQLMFNNGSIEIETAVCTRVTPTLSTNTLTPRHYPRTLIPDYYPSYLRGGK